MRNVERLSVKTRRCNFDFRFSVRILRSTHHITNIYIYFKFTIDCNCACVVIFDIIVKLL